ncbi:hypothetical protein PPYR_07223 [Photinus pyralis]|uniref:Borealin C-terminal domain-containing protein n=1 Tax=Photinus pyralis TaxID=7054 RepID=A0A1Y1KPK4_PHOPY|nr:borealin [Photinus pyralis]KAB0799343.1 hypothetical protein PPYR_07223 [Photinus pyralis]
MPRTKRLPKQKTSDNFKPSKSNLDHAVVSNYLKALDRKMAVKDMQIEAKVTQLLLTVENVCQESFLKFSQYGNLRFEELENTKSKESTTLYEKSVRAFNASKARGRPRSSSTTTRANPPSTVKRIRPSRSLSRTNTSVRANNLVTPMNKKIESYGMITPKVKPNTPQVVLRRPKQGEIALSMQGSPLMVDHIVSHAKPSVNIPLLDGRVCAIQPERGIRASQIPDLDPEIRRQIETLRDNLSKVLQSQ